MNLEAAIRICKEGKFVKLWRNTQETVDEIICRFNQIVIHKDSESAEVEKVDGRCFRVKIEEIHERKSQAFRALEKHFYEKCENARRHYLESLQEERGGQP